MHLFFTKCLNKAFIEQFLSVLNIIQLKINERYLGTFKVDMGEFKNLVFISVQFKNNLYYNKYSLQISECIIVCIYIIIFIIIIIIIIIIIS